jgi:hypothetical protein
MARSRTVCLRARRSCLARAAGAVVAVGLLVSCGDAAPTVAPVEPFVAPASGAVVTLGAGESVVASSGTALHLVGGARGGEYLLVVTDTVTDGSAGAATAVQISAANVGAPGAVTGFAGDRVPGLATTPAAPSALGPSLDYGAGARLNERARAMLRLRFTGARQARGARAVGARSADRLASTAAVGDLVTLNASNRACDSVRQRTGRIEAIGAKSIVVADTGNPAGGFTSAQFAQVAARFDTLVYPVDVANFGEPSDIDGNGRVILFFTRTVNEMTEPNAPSYVGGFYFSRDLFPATKSATLDACAGSNEGELFYLLAPDPNGEVNHNIRRTGFVDSVTASVVAHEFQHLINASRRLYVNTAATDFETVWLNEGLSHIAEELLFYREAGLTPGMNLDSLAMGTTGTRRANIFAADMRANAGRYHQYLASPTLSSPIADNDDISTRGATWNWLRYLADRKDLRGSQAASVWQPLVNTSAVGTTNLRTVFGPDLGGSLRDWSVSHYTDDVVAGIPMAFMQPSWNWHSLIPTLRASFTNGTYPLPVTALSTAGSATSVVPGGAAYYRFSVPPNTTATILATGSGTGASWALQATVVRLR